MSDERKEPQVNKFMLLRPPPDKCQICACKHIPEDAHNADSLFYQVHFRMRYERDGTWADAVAHCPPARRLLWEQELHKRNKWTEPPAGVLPRAEPIDG
jgi:hypothetical protein